MSPALRLALLQRRADIRGRWMELLFIEPVNSPLANPHSMIFMIDRTLDEVFAALGRHEPRPPVALPECKCGRNPYLAYFRAGIQALHEALVLIQAREPKLDPAARDRAFAELDGTIRGIARHEIETFAALCQHPLRTGEAPGDPMEDLDDAWLESQALPVAPEEKEGA